MASLPGSAAAASGSAVVVYVPVWLRRGHVAWLIVGTQAATSIVVVAPTSMLDALGDQLAGETP